MDDTPTGPQDFFDRIAQEVDGAVDGVVCKLELLTWSRAGAKINVPALTIQRELDGSVYDQLVEHLRFEGAGPGKYRIRLRFAGTGKGRMGPQSVEEMVFRPAEKPGTPAGAPLEAPPPPAGARAGTPEGDPLGAVLKTIQDVDRLREQLAPDKDEEPEKEEEDDDDDEEPEEEEQVQENPVGWKDKLLDKAISEGFIPLVGGIADWLGAAAKRMKDGHGQSARPAPPPPAARPPQQGVPVELVEDDQERAAG